MRRYPPPYQFFFRTGLGFHARQLSASQSILDSRQVGRDSSGDNAGVSRSLLTVGSQAIAGQGDQLGIGAAGVEPVQGVGQRALRGVLAHLIPSFASERRLARQDLAEDRAQAEHISSLVELAARLLGAMYDGVPRIEPARDASVPEPLRTVVTSFSFKSRGVRSPASCRGKTLARPPSIT
jgi:hypothetical protein